MRIANPRHRRLSVCATVFTALPETIVLLMRAGFGLWTGVKFTRVSGCLLSKLRTFSVPNRVSKFNLSASDNKVSSGPSHAGKSAVTKIAYSESESGNVVRTAIVPANRSEEPRFGPLDSTVIVVILLCFLLCVAGLIYPLI